MTQPRPAPAATRVFTTRAELEAAVSQIPTTMPKWRGEEGPRFRLEASPGSIRITSTDYSRANRSENEREDRRLRQTAEMLLEEMRTPSKRGEIVDWSPRARARMALRLATIDYTEMFRDGDRAAMVTLTAPNWWETLIPDATAFKNMVNAFRTAYKNSWGGRELAISGIWKMEFQNRARYVSDPRAPHLHIVTVPPEGRQRAPLSLDDLDHLRECEVFGCGNPLHEGRTASQDVHVLDCAGCRETAHTALYAFPEWLSRVWSAIVYRNATDAPVPMSSDEWVNEQRKHQRAGTNVSYDEVENYSDPKRIGVYFTKHGSFADKEYQNQPPKLWAGKPGARFWGYWVVRPLIISKETSNALIMHIVHHLRKVADASSYSRKVTLVEGGHNPRTGEVWEPRKRKRAVNRRVRRFRNRNGYGFLVVNNSLEVVADISRLISHYAENSMTSDVAAARRGLVSDAFDDDFFGAAPDHAPRGVLALHHDFDGAGSTEAQKLSRSKLDHSARDAIAAESLAFRENVAARAEGRPFVNPLGPVAPRVDTEAKIEQNWVSFLIDNTIPF